MGSISTISSKGQITLPQAVRQRLGVGVGDKVEFLFDGEQTIVRPVRGEENPFAKWVGIAKVPHGFDTNEWISEMRDDDERRADLEEIRLANGG